MHAPCGLLSRACVPGMQLHGQNANSDTLSYRICELRKRLEEAAGAAKVAAGISFFRGQGGRCTYLDTTRIFLHVT
jgi:hypothetical protein